ALLRPCERIRPCTPLPTLYGIRQSKNEKPHGVGKGASTIVPLERLKSRLCPPYASKPAPCLAWPAPVPHTCPRIRPDNQDWTTKDESHEHRHHATGRHQHENCKPGRGEDHGSQSHGLSAQDQQEDAGVAAREPRRQDHLPRRLPLR